MSAKEVTDDEKLYIYYIIKFIILIYWNKNKKLSCECHLNWVTYILLLKVETHTELHSKKTKKYNLIAINTFRIYDTTQCKHKL